jgi:predicted double-glycine peptidase
MSPGSAQRRVCAIGLLAAAWVQLAAEPLAVPFFRQQKNGCGAATVAMVAHYWGSRTTESLPSPQQIYDALYIAERKSIRLADMRQYLESLGFTAFTLRGKWQDLDVHIGRERPVIVALKPGRRKNIHFAVLTGVDSEYVWLNDPTRKKPSRMKRADFDQQWQTADRWLLLAAPTAR